MIDSLIRLGVAVQPDPATPALDVFGCAGRLPASKAQLYIGNSGTTVRFLTALATLGHGEFRLDGATDAAAADPRSARRARQFGCRRTERIGQRLPAGGRAWARPARRQGDVRGNVSSQFLSGLLLAAAYARAAGRADGRRPFSLTALCGDDAGRDARFGVTVESASPRFPSSSLTLPVV